VGGDRDELLADPDRGAGVVVEDGVLERLRGAARELARDRHLGGSEAAVLPREQPDHAVGAPPRDEGQRHGRARPEPRRAGRRLRAALRQLERVEHREPIGGPEPAQGGIGREGLRVRLEGRVGVRDEGLRREAVVRGEIDHAEVREERHRAARRGEADPAAVQRARELRRDPREEGERLAAADRLGDIHREAPELELAGVLAREEAQLGLEPGEAAVGPHEPVLQGHAGPARGEPRYRGPHPGAVVIREALDPEARLAGPAVVLEAEERPGARAHERAGERDRVEDPDDRVGDPLDEGSVAALRGLVAPQALQLQLRQLERVRAALVVAELLGLGEELALRAVKGGERGHLRAQHLRPDRLQEVVDAAALVPGQLLVLVLAVAGHEHDGDVAGPLVRPDQPGGLVTVQVRHVHVHEDERAALGEEEAQRLRARLRLHHLVLRRGERGAHREQVRGAIIHEQDLHALGGRTRGCALGEGRHGFQGRESRPYS
jgi:hypothetical protein